MTCPIISRRVSDLNLGEHRGVGRGGRTGILRVGVGLESPGSEEGFGCVYVLISGMKLYDKWVGAAYRLFRVDRDYRMGRLAIEMRVGMVCRI